MPAPSYELVRWMAGAMTFSAPDQGVLLRAEAVELRREQDDVGTADWMVILDVRREDLLPVHEAGLFGETLAPTALIMFSTTAPVQLALSPDKELVAGLERLHLAGTPPVKRSGRFDARLVERLSLLGSYAGARVSQHAPEGEQTRP